MMRIQCFIAACIFLAGTAFGQTTVVPPDSLPVEDLQTVVVEAGRLPGPIYTTPLSISTLDTTLLQTAQARINLNDALNTLPGVFALNANNYAQDLRLSIRGFGARSAFGIRGIKILVDGIPESTPDGQGQVDNIDPGTLEKLEVIRGPASGLYGNAAGGVVSFTTEEPPDRAFAEGRVTLGSFGLQRFQLKAGWRASKWSGIISGSNTLVDGFRANSAFQSSNIQAKLQYDISNVNRLQLVFGFVDSPKAEDPGSLNRALLDENRESAWQNNQLFRAGESVQQGRVALKWSYDWSVHHSIKARLFYQWRDFENRLPFEAGGSVVLGRQFMGGGVVYQYKGQLLNKLYRMQLGSDIELQQDGRQRFNNRQGVRGARTFSQDEIFNSIGSYLIQELWLSAKMKLQASLRVDLLKLEARDQFQIDGDDSGSRSYSRFNPGLGLNYQLHSHLFAFANYSQSFETPALSELSANPAGGGFNEMLAPQTSNSLEAGLKYSNFKKWSGQLAAYHIWLNNELIPYELSAFPSRVFYRNAGRSSRLGLEASVRWQPISRLRTQLAYTFAHYLYRDYQTQSENFRGNKLPGIPDHHIALLVNYQLFRRLSIQSQSRYVSAIFTSDDNTSTADRFFISHLRIQYHLQWKKWTLAPFLGINNLTNTRYNDHIRINAFGGRYFEPAPGINWYMGVKCRIR
jgi:iron complex outermembrane receptor protein